MTDGAEIRDARNSIGLSQEQLGKLVGVTGRHIRNYESGTTPIPTNMARRIMAVVAREGLPVDLTALSDVAVLAEIGALMSELARRLDDYKGDAARDPENNPEPTPDDEGSSSVPANPQGLRTGETGSRPRARSRNKNAE